VHGKFFETVPVPDLISQSFLQALDETMKDADPQLLEELKQKIGGLFKNQETFSRVRTVSKASVRLRFRIMTEVLAEGNLLNNNKYPQIKDNTLNFLIPCHSAKEENIIKKRMKTAFKQREIEIAYSQLDIFTLKHLLNGPFLVFQIPLKD